MNAPRIATGIFSGSFNPVHIGHLALANYLCEFENLDEIWFVVSPHNPLKEQKELLGDALRLQMVKMAVGGYPKFKASDFEFGLPRPSYTVDTLAALEKAYPERSFYFIMGADNWLTIDRWKDHRTLVERYPVLVYPRKGYEAAVGSELLHVRAVDAPLMEISSSFIREAIRRGKDMRFFLPPGVYPLCKQAILAEK